MKMKIITFFCFALLLLGCIVLGIKLFWPIKEPYEYPVRPGTEEWVELKNDEERYEACIVPKITLSRMTTKALAETVITYPYLFDAYTIYNDVNQGFKAISENHGFLGVEELKTRKDACPVLREYMEEHQDQAEISEEGNDDYSYQEGWIHYQNAAALLEYLE